MDRKTPAHIPTISAATTTPLGFVFGGLILWGLSLGSWWKGIRLFIIALWKYGQEKPLSTLPQSRLLLLHTYGVYLWGHGEKASAFFYLWFLSD